MPFSFSLNPPFRPSLPDLPGLPALSVTALVRRVKTALGGEVGTAALPTAAPAHLRGSGSVVVVGGFCTAAVALDPMRDWLTALGYDVTVCTVDAGMGCGARSVARLRSAVREAAEADPEGVVRLVGYSRGGQFTRALARDESLPVRSLVTVGTPFDLLGVARPLLLQVAAVAAAGTLGVRGLFSFACLRGACCASYREELRAPVPVPFSAIFSRTDRLVRWQSCQDPTAHTVELETSHLGLIGEPEPLRAVAAELRRCEDAADVPADAEDDAPSA